MKIKINELTGATLDWAVAQCEGLHPELADLKRYRGTPREVLAGWFVRCGGECPYEPSTEWSDGGPIMEREKIAVYFDKHSDITDAGPWIAGFNLEAEDGYAYSEHTVGSPSINLEHGQSGPAPLIAAMRAYVASKRGEYVEVPDELVKSIAP